MALDQDLEEKANGFRQLRGVMERFNPGSAGAWFDNSYADLVNQQTARTQQAQKALSDNTSALNNQKSQMISQYGDQARQGLAQDLAGVKRGANSRGLLYSGLRQGAENDMRGQAANSAASYASQVDNAAADKVSDYSNTQAQHGIDKYNMDNQHNISAYQDALSKRGQQQQAASAIGGGIGALGGALAGKYLGK